MKSVDLHVLNCELCCFNLLNIWCNMIMFYCTWQYCNSLFVLQLFVGLSFPYEGPAPLEAIANGCAFLNPRFDPPKSSKNTDFFKGKPTLREVLRLWFFIIILLRVFVLRISSIWCMFDLWPQLTSQHPYAEVYIGRPHVWTVNIDDPAEVENAIKAILSQKVHLLPVHRLHLLIGLGSI